MISYFKIVIYRMGYWEIARSKIRGRCDSDELHLPPYCQNVKFL